MENEIENIILKRIDKLEENNTTDHKTIMDTCCSKRDLDRVIESNNRRIEMLAGEDKEARTDIDSHCIRIRELERQRAVQDAEFAPIKKAYDNLTSFMVGFFIIVGSLFIGAIIFLKDKLK